MSGGDRFDLALALAAAGLTLMVVNPKAAKRFAETLLARTKTDAVDAAALAEFAQRMPYLRLAFGMSALSAARHERHDNCRGAERAV